MRSFVLLLLLANVVFFLYARFVEQPTVDTGVVVRTEAELTPAAELLPPPAPPPPPSCFKLAYFESVDAAQEAMRAIDGLPGDWLAEETTQDVFVGYWVQVTGLTTRAEASRYQQRLQQGGVEESYRAGDDNEGYALSLGLFSERDRAERVLEQATGLDVPATIIERYRPEPAAIVTIELPNPTVLEAIAAGDEALNVTDCDIEVTDAAAGDEQDSEAEADADREE